MKHSLSAGLYSTTSSALSRSAAWVRRNGWLTFSIVLVCVGILLRTRRMFFSVMPLWGDEALSALELVEFRFERPSVRPVGFMLASRFIANTFGPSEPALRFLPWVSGVLATVLAIPLSRRLLHSPAAQVLLVALIALHPIAIDFSKEFKPYSVSLLLHLCCLYTAASYWDTHSKLWLKATVGIGFFGVLFAQDVLFAYPALYLAMAVSAWRSRVPRHAVLVVGGALATLGLLLTLYFFHWRHMGGLEAVRKGARFFGFGGVWWSQSYDLFHVNPNESSIAWYFRKYLEIATFPGSRRSTWTGLGPLTGSHLDVLRQIDATIWALLHAIGLVTIVIRRRLRECLLLLVPLVVLTIFNFMQRWPYGAFRTNLFTLAYTAPIACLALDSIRVKHRERPGWQLVPVLLLSVLPLVLFERSWHRVKESANSEFWQIARVLITLYDRPPEKTRRELLILDGYGCTIWRYYQSVYPNSQALFDELGRRFRWRCVRGFKSFPLAEARRFQKHRRDSLWLVMLFGENWRRLERDPLTDYRIVAKQEIGDGVALVVQLEPRVE